jgi:uncharacterized protein (TIGR00290 family)
VLRTARTPVACLLTTVTEPFERVSMHGVRVSLLHRQAEALGLALREVRLAPDPDNDTYDAAMAATFAALRAEGLTTAAFGDLHLADVRAYREERCARAGVEAVFPLWGSDTSALAERVIADGYRAVVVCIDSAVLDDGFVGRDYDEAFLADLPAGADPCGENGEFHTFVWDGPLHTRPVPVRVGEVVQRGQFRFADLLGA